MSLSNDERLRYARHLALPDFTLETQEKLKQARVLVVGAGGLGAPILQYLTAAGIGTLGIIDYDLVDISNLQRQVIYRTEDIRKAKTKMAILRLNNLNPHTRFVEYEEQLTSENALEIIGNYDLVIDGSDNFPTRYLINDACYFQGKPLIYGSVFRYEGQVSVFNARTGSGDTGPNYRDLFPEPPPPEMIPNCETGGVLGVLPGIIGSVQAQEAIKLITGIGDPLIGKLFIWDALQCRSRIIKIKKQIDNPLSGKHASMTGLIDYEVFCKQHTPKEYEEIDAGTLEKWIRDGMDFQIIDVREPLEWEKNKIGGMLIPEGDLDKRVAEISDEKPVVLYCRSGGRSSRAVVHLKHAYGFENLLNLKGGMQAWIKHKKGS